MILFQETICKTLCNQTMNYIHVACALRWQISIPAFIPSKLIAKASTSLSKLPCGMNQLVQRLNSAFADLLCVVFHTRNSIFYFAMSETKISTPSTHQSTIWSMLVPIPSDMQNPLFCLSGEKARLSKTIEPRMSVYGEAKVFYSCPHIYKSQ